MAETLPRAPKPMRRLGLEWLFRLFHDPKRLALRYLKDLYFVVIVARQILKKLI
jgi:N-acetylglucosaminyldiphosphoundecaprenol N-acetyl-beta-D-mannosaminyltransferase